MSDINYKGLLTAEDVATQLGCSEGLVYKMFHDKRIRGIRLSPRCIRFAQEEVNRIKEVWKEVNFVPITEETTPIVRKDSYAENKVD